MPSDSREAAAWRLRQEALRWEQDAEDGVYDREPEMTYALHVLFDDPDVLAEQRRAEAVTYA